MHSLIHAKYFSEKFQEDISVIVRTDWPMEKVNQSGKTPIIGTFKEGLPHGKGKYIFKKMIFFKVIGKMVIKTVRENLNIL